LEAENYKQIKTRVDKGMKKIGKKAEENGDNNILLVSHGLTIRTMIDMYSNDANSTVDIDNGSVTELIYKNGEYYLNKANDTNYLKKVND
jgi:broad specificity phosphatase PhoE